MPLPGFQPSAFQGSGFQTGVSDGAGRGAPRGGPPLWWRDYLYGLGEEPSRKEEVAARQAQAAERAERIAGMAEQASRIVDEEFGGARKLDERLREILDSIFADREVGASARHKVVRKLRDAWKRGERRASTLKDLAERILGIRVPAREDDAVQDVPDVAVRHEIAADSRTADTVLSGGLVLLGLGAMVLEPRRTTRSGKR